MKTRILRKVQNLIPIKHVNLLALVWCLSLMSCDKPPSIGGLVLTSSGFAVSSGDFEGYIISDRWSLLNDTISRNQILYNSFLSSVDVDKTSKEEFISQQGQFVKRKTSTYKQEDSAYEYLLIEVNTAGYIYRDDNFKRIKVDSTINYAVLYRVILSFQSP